MSFTKNPLEPLPQNLLAIEGINKLRRSITKELSTIEDKCSNLPHLLSIVKVVNSLTEKNETPLAVLKSFNFTVGKSNKLTIDIVSSDGTVWYKISARNPKSLTLVANEEGDYGKRTIIHHAEDYLNCANENHCRFKAPKVNFVFANGIGIGLAQQLEIMGIVIIGDRIEDSNLDFVPTKKVSSYMIEIEKINEPNNEKLLETNSNNEFNLKHRSLEGVKNINLDVSVLLCYVSNLTNGHANAIFDNKPILSHQAKAELERPQKKILDNIFKGRQLYACETAINNFKSILSTVAGPKEKERSKELLERVIIIPDDLSSRLINFEISGNIKERSLIIFGTGDKMEFVTVTANIGFVRSAQMQGVGLDVFLIESRALSEQKEGKEVTS